MPTEAEQLRSLLHDIDLSGRRSLSEDVVAALRAAIVRGRFSQGQHLSETSLAEAFSVSRGPIREAFAALEREGLLTLERHRGARVRRLSSDDFREIYELRRALERLAIERAALHGRAEDFTVCDDVVRDIAAAVEAEDVAKVVELDVCFHDGIYRAAQSTRLYQSWATLRPQIETFLFSRSTDQRNYLSKAVDEHTALLDLMRARRDRDAVAMIEEHLRSAYERLAKLFV